MRIVIVGTGKVGTTLAEQLSMEDHDIFVIDQNQTTVDHLVNTLDIMGVCGNGASYQVLLEAEVQKADLLVACTSHDEINLLCCLVAKKLGAQNTIARVRNPEYSDQLVFMRDELGLSMSINPERAAASELYKLLKFPSALQIETFSNKRVEMAEIKLREDSVLDNVYLRDLHKTYKGKALICSVQRGNQITIPGGNFMLKSGDKINVVARADDMYDFFSSLGRTLPEARDVMLVGGGRISFYLARMLTENGASVKIIDIDPKRCAELSRLLPHAMIICGDGTDQELLSEEGIDTMDAVVALTGFDEENIILALYAQSATDAKIITKINRPSLAAIAESTGLGSIISPRVLTANIIVRYVRSMQNSMGSNIETLHRLMGGAVEALEFRVNDTFPQTHVPLMHLRLKPNILIACISRSGQTIIPGGRDYISVGDRVIVIAAGEHFDDLSDILAEDV
ncbi:MAG: Trk system potassium transporter TrkA [Clostridia bacterium]|nr:Trk system potassium transporter TrkA [Clostridia bacterium]MBR5283691.1 Trk system potassium transporter TrkA [Clostridia bacterium]